MEVGLVMEVVEVEAMGEVAMVEVEEERAQEVPWL